MRQAFVRALAELVESDPRVMLLTGDLGYMVLEPFAEAHPERFINVGVAEQNMVGLATGLAECGFLPFVYSITPFAVLRPYEFIRNGPVLHQLPVRVIGVGCGTEYGHNGLSHYALEDIGLMRMQPGIAVVCPADSQQARSALLATWAQPGPVYYRLSKDEHGRVPGLDGRFEMGRPTLLGCGTDVLFVATGSITREAVAAATRLGERGVGCSVMVVSTLSPAPTEPITDVLRRFRLALTVEAHYPVGGLGSLVAEALAEHAVRCRLVRCGIGDVRDGITGTDAYLCARHGLTGDALAETALRALGGGGS